MRLQGPSRVSLFAYDNDTYVVHSFLDRMGSVELVADGRDVTRSSTCRRAPSCRARRAADETVFTVFLEPHSYRAFERRRAGGERAPRPAPSPSTSGWAAA